jgi:hypothetical protein
MTINVHLQSNPNSRELLLKIVQGESGNSIQIIPAMISTGNRLDGLIHDIFGKGESLMTDLYSLLKMKMHA